MEGGGARDSGEEGDSRQGGSGKESYSRQEVAGCEGFAGLRCLPLGCCGFRHRPLWGLLEVGNPKLQRFRLYFQDILEIDYPKTQRLIFVFRICWK